MSLTATIRRFLGAAQEERFDPHAYWEERHATHKGSLKAVSHRTLSEAQSRAQYQTKSKRVTRLIARHVEKTSGKTLLDAGCGIGTLSQVYVDAGFATTGVDFSAVAVDQARRNVPDAEFVLSPLSALELPQRFDVICVTDVLLHIVDDEEWRAALAALVRHLGPSGLLVILDCFEAGDTAWAKHCRPRPLEAYQSAFAELGCRIVEHERFVLDNAGETKDLAAIRQQA